MRIVRRATEGIRWPRREDCRAKRDEEEGDDCICRNYDGAEGYYVIGEDRHAYAYYRDRCDAKAASVRPVVPVHPERVPLKRHRLIENSEEE